MKTKEEILEMIEGLRVRIMTLKGEIRALENANYIGVTHEISAKKAALKICTTRKNALGWVIKEA